MQLANLPPETINIIYEFLDIKSKIRFSLSNWYIYDCRPIYEINHRKKMNPVINDINSIQHYIINYKTSKHALSGDTHRLIGYKISVYRYCKWNGHLHSFKKTNYWSNCPYTHHIHAKFEYGSFPFAKKRQHTEVDMKENYGNIYMRIR